MKGPKNVTSIEEVLRGNIKAFDIYREIECPNDSVGHIPNYRNICFAGNADAEDLIRAFTDNLAQYLEKDVYWRRDFGIWHTQMNFKNSDHPVAITVMMKGDAKTLQSNPDMKNYNIFIACAIFDQ